MDKRNNDFDFDFKPIGQAIKAACRRVDASLDRLDDKELSVIEATVNGLCKAKESKE